MEATVTARVMSRPIDEATACTDLPCWEKRGPPEGGVVVGSEEGTRIRDAGGPSQPRDHSNALPPRHGIYALVTRLLQAHLR
jgi:hypothetical protein